MGPVARFSSAELHGCRCHLVQIEQQSAVVRKEGALLNAFVCKRQVLQCSGGPSGLDVRPVYWKFT